MSRCDSVSMADSALKAALPRLHAGHGTRTPRRRVVVDVVARRAMPPAHNVSRCRRSTAAATGAAAMFAAAGTELGSERRARRGTRHRLLPVPHCADPLSSVITHGPHHTRGSRTQTDNMSGALRSPLLAARLLLHCSRGENEQGAARGRAQGPHAAFRPGPARAAESGQRGRNVTSVTTARRALPLVRMFVLRRNSYREAPKRRHRQSGAAVVQDLKTLQSVLGSARAEAL